MLPLCASEISITDSLHDMARSFSSIQKLENPAKIQNYDAISQDLIEKVESISTFFDQCYHSSETLSENMSENFSLHILQQTDRLNPEVSSLATTIREFCLVQNANKKASPAPSNNLSDAPDSKDSVPSLLLACANLNNAFSHFLRLYEQANHKIFTRFEFINRFNTLHQIFSQWNNRLNHIIQTDRSHASPNMDLLHAISSVKNELYQFHLKISALESEYNRIEQMETIRRNQQILTENLAVLLASKAGDPVALIFPENKTNEPILCIYRKNQWRVARSNSLEIPLETPILLSDSQTIQSPDALKGCPAPTPFVLHFNQLLAKVLCVEATPQTTNKGNIIFKKGSLVYENRNLAQHIANLYHGITASHFFKS